MNEGSKRGFPKVVKYGRDVDDGTVNYPKTINLGSGKNYMPDALNIDINPMWEPDILCDISLSTGFEGIVVSEDNKSAILLTSTGRGYFEKIIAHDVLEHIDDLTSAMTNCLHLLQEGGTMDILVPYDLSLGAWQDPTHVRAFNENSFIYYDDWCWYLGWKEFKFRTQKIELRMTSYGLELQAAAKTMSEIVRTPRAIDSMHVILEKVKCS